MVPAWFGSLATLFTYLLTVELSGSTGAGVFSAWVMAIIPAHMMRSAAGEFDNECVAVAAFCAVLWLWVRSLRTPRSWPWGLLTGIAYAYAAAAWGGYIFINNLVGLHAAFLVGIGKYNSGLHRAFSIYYVVGTFGAMYVPVIGWAPLRSLEQMPSLLVFLGFQVMEACDMYRRARAKSMSGFAYFWFRVFVFALAGVAGCAVGHVLMEMGVFTPLGARIRGLFLDAVKTGNPLVDSVAEHHPSNDQAYNTYLGDIRFLAFFGLFFCWHQDSPGKFLTVLYAAVAYHYSLKMSRLMIICGPIVSVLAGFPVGIIGDWCIEQFIGVFGSPSSSAPAAPLPARTGGMGSIWRTMWYWFGPWLSTPELNDLSAWKDSFHAKRPILDKPLRVIIAFAILMFGYRQAKAPLKKFIGHSDTMAEHMSNPQLVFKSKLRDGTETIVSDYLDGYRWIAKNTPKDARVMAWWDYGYQITGVANRTSVADGNTWNHEHIATLGRILTSNEKKSHKAMRHLADYALVWAGGHGDDMGKSPHLARIGNSVFPDHCGDDDPLCKKYSFSRDGSPTPMMAESFLYKAVNHNVQPGVTLNKKYWKEVHTTKFGLMRVFKVLNVSKESKEWVAEQSNRVCDAPGSWYCVGQYPPALKPLIAKRRSFAQLEDFNKKGNEKSAYTKLIEQERDGKKEL
jgi:dolichyl-diphosphooligosaccharide--protein glycosyltransferase